MKTAPTPTLASLSEFEFDIDIDKLSKEELFAAAKNADLKPKAGMDESQLRMLLCTVEDDCALRDALFLAGVPETHPCFSIPAPKRTRAPKPAAKAAPPEKAEKPAARPKPAPAKPKASPKPAKPAKQPAKRPDATPSAQQQAPEEGTTGEQAALTI